MYPIWLLSDLRGSRVKSLGPGAPTLAPPLSEGGSAPRSGHRFSIHALNAAAQAARQRRSHLSLTSGVLRSSEIPAYLSAPRRHRSWKWRVEWAAAPRPDRRSNPLDRNGEHIS